MPRSKRQIRGRDLWNESRSIRDAQFFTLGYVGRSLHEIVVVLKEARVRTLLDIRANAVSRFRPEFNKSHLRRFLEQEGICYKHVPGLGVPRKIRVPAINQGQRDTIWPWYDKHVIPGYLGKHLHGFLNSTEHPIAMMCAEANPEDCHRHRLCLELEARGMRGYDL